MADITYTQFPIEADIVDISQMETDIGNAQTDILNLGQNKADKTTTINGLSLAQNRTLYVQDIPSKNLLPNTTVTQTINDVTFTVNADGSITANGTASATALFNIVENYPLPSDTYILSGCPAGGDSDSSYTLRVRFTGSATMYNDNGDGVTVDATGGKTIYALNIRIASGYHCDNLVFRPMIRLSTITDDTYVPYAKTNVELTKTEKDSITLATGWAVNDDTSPQLYKSNRLVTFNLSAIPPSYNLSLGWNTIGTLPQGFKPPSTITFNASLYGSGNTYITTERVQLKDGALQVSASTARSNVIRVVIFGSYISA